MPGDGNGLEDVFVRDLDGYLVEVRAAAVGRRQRPDAVGREELILVEEPAQDRFKAWSHDRGEAVVDDLAVLAVQE